MRVIVACEFSGIVRDAFNARGHEAYSCDLLPTELDSPYHFQCNIREIDLSVFDLMIAHPPCTYLAVSGARWWSGRRQEQEDALSFVRYLLDAPIPMIALENPIGAISTHIRKPDQIIQPCQFGHNESKATCLWLKRLPYLIPTHEPSNDWWKNNRVHREPPSKDRQKNRSRTYRGIARAMAEQWSDYLECL
jgi:hypothetical protein